LSVISLPNFKALHNFKHLSIQKGISDYLARDYNVSFDFFRNYVLFAPEGYFYMLYMK
jgi:hypothetical protein